MIKLLPLSPGQRLYFLAILGSIILSWLLNRNALINPDGVLYIQTAQAFLQGGLDAALAVYKWPFYSILIALIHQITQLSMDNAAILLNTFLCILIVTGFISLVKRLGGNYQVQVCAAIIILLHTGLNDHRAYIIRDFGHWAFMLYAVYFLIVYAQNRQLRYALAFGCSIFIAFLFRTEALFILLFAPLALLLPTQGLSLAQRLVQTLGAYIILIPLMAVGAFYIELFTTNPWLKATVSTDLISAFAEQISQYREILPIHLKDSHVIFFILGGLLSYFFVHILIVLSLPYSFLVGYAVYKKSMPASIAHRIVITAIFIYLVIVLAFLSYKFFLTGRYIMPVVLLLSLWAPFGLSAIYDAWLSRKTWLFPLIIASLLYVLGDSVISTAPSQLYIKDAGLWLGDNALETSTSYTNNRQVLHYSQHATYGDTPALFEILNNGKWQQYDYLAINSKNKDTQLRERLALLPITPIQVFTNERGDKVEIYKTR